MILHLHVAKSVTQTLNTAVGAILPPFAASPKPTAFFYALAFTLRLHSLPHKRRRCASMAVEDPVIDACKHYVRRINRTHSRLTPHISRRMPIRANACQIAVHNASSELAEADNGLVVLFEYGIFKDDEASSTDPAI